MENFNLSQNTHIILVEPQESLNIGSVARAMYNLGFEHLHLVAPRGYDPKKASYTACWATEILEKVTIHADFPSAISSMQQVIGFSARAGKNRVEPTLLPELKHQIKACKTALVFGPEESGLRNEHVIECNILVKIPANCKYPSFNLAQAVILALYELNSLELTKLEQNILAEDLKQEDRPATWQNFAQLDKLVDSVANKVSFYHTGTPAHIPTLFANIFRRINPSQREMSMLLGLFSKIDKRIKTD